MSNFEQIMEYHSTILCCDCGVGIAPNPANMCVPCLQSRYRIEDGIPKSYIIRFCRGCGRYHQPPDYWVTCELESRELLAICLKLIRGLSKVKLVNAEFIWTEPHSRRIKVNVAIEREIMPSLVLHHEFVVEYKVENFHCNDCHRAAAKDHWNAVVQVRQKVKHKRTFLWLEQIILKHQMHKKCVNIKDCHDGLDFFFASKSEALKLCSFFEHIVPIRIKKSERLICSDVHNNTANFKFTCSVEIIPLCRDDLVCLPQKIMRLFDFSSPFAIVTKVVTSVHFIDPFTLKTGYLNGQAFWREEFKAIASITDACEYIVLDSERTGVSSGKFIQVNLEVAKASDFGSNDKTLHLSTHAGRYLSCGDIALGYDLANININQESLNNINVFDFPEAILVKKTFPEARKNMKKRRWKLKNIKKNNVKMDYYDDEGGYGEEMDILDSNPSSKRDDMQNQVDYEIFLRDLEEDEELRTDINLYKNEAWGNEDDLRRRQDIENNKMEPDFPDICPNEIFDVECFENDE